MAHTVIEDEAGNLFCVWRGRLAAQVDRDDLPYPDRLDYLKPSRSGWDDIEGDEFELIRSGVDCPECEGSGRVEVLDTLRITPVSINQPTKMIDCPECRGTRYSWEYAHRFVTRAELEAMTEEGLP